VKSKGGGGAYKKKGGLGASELHGKKGGKISSGLRDFRNPFGGGIEAFPSEREREDAHSRTHNRASGSWGDEKQETAGSRRKNREKLEADPVTTKKESQRN